MVFAERSPMIQMQVRGAVADTPEENQRQEAVTTDAERPAGPGASLGTAQHGPLGAIGQHPASAIAVTATWVASAVGERPEHRSQVA